jgi:hypothetical protein
MTTDPRFTIINANVSAGFSGTFSNPPTEFVSTSTYTVPNGTANGGSAYIFPGTYSGYTCGACGAFVADGTAHTCSPWSFQQNYPFPKLTPHRCPVCEGRGQVAFDPEASLDAARNTPHTCPTCEGRRVLWG